MDSQFIEGNTKHDRLVEIFQDVAKKLKGGFVFEHIIKMVHDEYEDLKIIKIFCRFFKYQFE